MLRRIDLTAARADARDALPRAPIDVAAALNSVAPLVADVHARGYAAAREATLRFDGVDVPAPRVGAAALIAALDALDPAVRDGLAESIRRARIVHEAQRREPVDVQVVPGGTVTERWVPVRRVGLYVPGGLAVYPSSVVMNVVPAQVAGVESVAVCSPPQRDSGGRPHPAILAACALLGVDEVYAVGGAQAVALMAYGDAAVGIEPADMVTGPGNVYVAAAKRLLRGVIGIDAEAGPTEIAVLADASADPVHVAADLISQAEHDPLAASVLITDSADLAAAVDAEVERQVGLTKHVERIRAALTGEQSAIVLVRDVEQGLAVVDAYSSAPTARSRSATTAPGRTTCCRPAARRATRPGCRCRHSSRACTWSSTTTRRWPTSPRTCSRWPRPRTSPRTVPPSRPGCRERAVRHREGHPRRAAAARRVA